MTKKLCLMLLCLATMTQYAYAQNYTLKGRVKDAANGEDLIGAAVVVEGVSGKGATTNTYGFYSLTLAKGTYQISIQYIGYQSVIKEVVLDKDVSLDIELREETESLEEVVVSAETANANVTKTEMSVAKISPKDVETVPVLFGEKDIIKMVQLLPGVKTSGEGGSGFSVRGGGLDQNLILLDEAPVYNASHLLGFFSVFNSDAIKDVTLYKGGMPAEYGGRASSVMDVIMKDGNAKRFGASGGIGLISSKLTLEAPIVKDKGSFIVSGRRTYADLFLKLSSNEDLKNTTLYFYDLNLKANYQITDRDRIYVSGYFGRDNFGFDDEFGFSWGNATGTLRWNHIFNDRLFGNTSLIYSDYDYAFDIGADEEKFTLESGIKDWNLKQDFSYFLNSKNTIKFGANVIRHNFVPGKISTGSESSFAAEDIDEQYAVEGALYVQNEQKVGLRWSFTYGLRYSVFDYMGAGEAYEIDDDGIVTSTQAYGDWESIQFYHGLEPRASAKYLLNETSSIKVAYNRNYQYMHLLSNSTSGSPTDRWVPSSNNVKPQIADQVAAGYFRNFKDNMFEFSAEVYYKEMQNLIDYRTGADLVFNSSVETELVYGSGKAYGLELLLKKTQGKFTGWLSYTLSRSLREFDDIDDGKIFPSRQDRIHDLSVTAIYAFHPKWTASANFVFYTGDAVTFPSGKYESAGRQVPYYTERNGYRFPNYHRMDLGLTWTVKKTEKFESSWNFSVYNAYGRENPYIINFEENEDTGQTEAVQFALFKAIPSISYNFRF
ncbi:TonB-dependent receptor [Owenweeksia hongkongensis]|uniref:TonB-dependent receptor n=1 Tax=Owenweeksia hongkongensis TaxID=253245 RepID=UPI003A8CF826